MDRRLGLLACFMLFGTATAFAQQADVTSQASVCENRSGHETPQGRVDACTALLQGTQRPAQEAMTLVNRAWSFSLEHKGAEAVADYNRAAALTPGMWAVFNERGLFYLRSGQFDAAIKDYNAALKITPGAAYSLYGRGLTWRRKGDTARGDADLAAARSADPKVDQIFEYIGLRP